MSSFQIKVSYDVSTVLSSESGLVKDASCTCKASAMGRCNHIAGLLFALLDFTKEAGNDTSCTSLTCEWNKGRSSKKNPTQIFKASYPSSKKEKTVNLCPTNIPDPTPEDDCANFLRELQSFSAGKIPSMWETLLYIRYKDYVLDDLQLEVLHKNMNTSE